MVVTCVALGCKNRFKSVPGITFHSFPKNAEMRSRWELAVNREGWHAKDGHVLCSVHFAPECFDRTGQTTRLRLGSVPTVFPAPTGRPKKREKRKCSAPETRNCPITENAERPETVELPAASPAKEGYQDRVSASEDETPLPKKMAKAAQECTGRRRRSVDMTRKVVKERTRLPREGSQYSKELEAESLLFDQELLEGLDTVKGVSIELPKVDASWRVRPLSSADYDQGFLDLLVQLKAARGVSREQFLARFAAMKAASGTYFVTVIEDINRGLIVATATLLVKLKFSHGLTTKGHIEDVVVSNKYWGRNLGKLIVQTVVRLGKRLGCHRLTLNCKDTGVKFYANNGFTLKAGSTNSMSLRYGPASALKS